MSLYNILKPGHTPAGWRRGDPLFIVPASPGNQYRAPLRGCVRQADLQPVGSVRGDDVAYVAFDHANCAAVDEWLKWWHA